MLDVCSPTPQHEPLLQLHPLLQTLFTILCNILFFNTTDTSLSAAVPLRTLKCVDQVLVGIAELSQKLLPCRQQEFPLSACIYSVFPINSVRTCKGGISSNHWFTSSVMRDGLLSPLIARNSKIQTEEVSGHCAGNTRCNKYIGIRYISSNFPENNPKAPGNP